MNNFLTIEWENDCGIHHMQMLDFLDGISDKISLGDYGQSISKVRVIIICRSFQFKQRKRLSKSTKILDFDIILPYEPIMEAPKEKKVEIISSEVIAACEKVFYNYKFTEFDTSKFLNDWKNAVIENTSILLTTH